MASIVYPKWLRGLDIVLGLISVIVGLWVIVDRALAEFTILVLFSMVMLLVGFERILKSISFQDLKVIARAANLLAGVVLIIGAIAIWALPGITIMILVMLIGFGFIVLGAARVVWGVVEASFPGWWRGLQTIVGLISITVGIMAIAVPALGFLTLILLISLTFISNGFTRIADGVTGLP